MNDVVPTHRQYWLAASIISLGLNLILLLQLLVRIGAERTLRHSTNKSIGLDSNRLNSVETSVSPPASEAAWHWSDLSSLDFQSLRSRLQSMGCPEHAIRAILEVQINQEYRPKLAALFRKADGDFWEKTVAAKTSRKAARTPEQVEAGQAFEALRREKETRFQELLGPDWAPRGTPRHRYDLDPDPRLSFLSEEKRQRMEEQQGVLRELQQMLRTQGVAEADANKEVKALQAQQELDQAQFLSPEEAEEYRNRRSPYNHVAQNLYGFEPSSQERETIIRLHEAHANDSKVLDVELRKALGDERSAQFQRARDRNFESIYKVADYLGLPEERMISVYELKKSAEETAKTIRADRELNGAQRDEHLRALKEETLGGLASRFGPEGRDLYLKNGGWWVGGLGK